MFLLLSTAALAGLMPVNAQWGGNPADFRPYFEQYDPNATEGSCTLRLRIDEEAEVRMQQDRVQIRTLRGRPGSDAGSQCTSPMPRRGIVNFDFRKTGGRGDVQMIQQPGANSNGFAARISDRDSGEDTYVIEIRWQADRFSGRGGRDGNVNPNDSNRPGGGWGDWPPSGNAPQVTELRDARRNCREAVRSEASRRYNIYNIDVRFSQETDSSPNGRWAILSGQAMGRDNWSNQTYDFECRVDADTGRVQRVRMRR
ncbi:MAG: hypothetical protein K2X35_20410 [Bryobacteraceae bacterium]|nr:hypothetical protein [Bryobacteraceae bacterium]